MLSYDYDLNELYFICGENESKINNIYTIFERLGFFIFWVPSRQEGRVLLGKKNLLGGNKLFA